MTLSVRPKNEGLSFLFFSFFLGRTKQLKEEEEEEAEGEAPLATTAKKEPIQSTPEEEWKTNTRTSSGGGQGDSSLNQVISTRGCKEHKNRCTNQHNPQMEIIRWTICTVYNYSFL